MLQATVTPQADQISKAWKTVAAATAGFAFNRTLCHIRTMLVRPAHAGADVHRSIMAVFG